MPMAVRQLRRSWWIDITFNDKRYRIRSPENSRPGALAYEAVLRQRLSRGEPIRPPRNGAVHESFEQFARRWFDEYVVPNNKYSERITKRYILEATLIPFFGKMHIEDITAHHVEKYKAKYMRTGVSNKTINNRLTVLSKCLTTAYEWFALERTPPKIKRLKCAPPHTDFLSVEECDLLLAHARDVVRELILTALRTGMRQGELTGLQWSSIDWCNRIVTVRHSRCEYQKALVSPKSNRERYIPLDAELFSLLLQRRRSEGYVFLGTDGKPFDQNRMSRRLSAVCKRAGLRRVTWHKLRHTFASHLAMKGVSLNVVQSLLGHTSITTTIRYAHVAPSSLRAAIELLQPKAVGSANFGQPAGNASIERRSMEAAQI